MGTRTWVGAGDMEAPWPLPWACGRVLGWQQPREAGLTQQSHTQVIVQSLFYQMTVFPNGRPPAKRPSGCAVFVLLGKFREPTGTYTCPQP